MHQSCSWNGYCYGIGKTVLENCKNEVKLSQWTKKNRCFFLCSEQLYKQYTRKSQPLADAWIVLGNYERRRLKREREGRVTSHAKHAPPCHLRHQQRLPTLLYPQLRLGLVPLVLVPQQREQLPPLETHVLYSWPWEGGRRRSRDIRCCVGGRKKK